MIGKAINKLLSDNAALTALVSTKIYPIVIALDTVLPAVIYTVDTVTPEYTKDGWIGDDCIFKVTSYAKDYANAASVAVAVRKALELESGTYNSISIGKIYMTGQEEYYQFDADVYINRLTFQTKINAYA